MTPEEFKAMGPSDLYVIADVKKRFEKRGNMYRNISNEVINNFIREESTIQEKSWYGFGNWKEYKKYGIARAITQQVYDRCYMYLTPTEKNNKTLGEREYLPTEKKALQE